IGLKLVNERFQWVNIIGQVNHHSGSQGKSLSVTAQRDRASPKTGSVSPITLLIPVGADAHGDVLTPARRWIFACRYDRIPDKLCRPVSSQRLNPVADLRGG
ncbi:hypothetical protein, partial [Photorhabdus cinerea]|uniref:hypothetical protein n=1 Tax=Photorhabdus cinerea TaxID=471575 RepID=UPI00140A9A46